MVPSSIAGAMDLLLKGFSSMQKLNIDLLSQAALMRNFPNHSVERGDFERVPSPGTSESSTRNN